jgi:hypothetical protein
MRAFVFAMLVAIAGCAPAADQPVAPPAPALASQPAPLPAPEAARRVPKDLLTQDGVNYECTVPADCAVKDVGNCCGYYPQCVAKDSPTFPEKVKAECAAKGMASVCGFPSISGCDCVEGRCTGVPGMSGDVQ